MEKLVPKFGIQPKFFFTPDPRILVVVYEIRVRWFILIKVYHHNDDDDAIKTTSRRRYKYNQRINGRVKTESPPARENNHRQFTKDV